MDAKFESCKDLQRDWKIEKPLEKRDFAKQKTPSAKSIVAELKERKKTPRVQFLRIVAKKNWQ